MFSLISLRIKHFSVPISVPTGMQEAYKTAQMPLRKPVSMRLKFPSPRMGFKRPEVQILSPRPNHNNPNLFLIGEGFGFIVYFGTFFKSSNTRR